MAVGEGIDRTDGEGRGGREGREIEEMKKWEWKRREKKCGREDGGGRRWGRRENLTSAEREKCVRVGVCERSA